MVDRHIISDNLLAHMQTELSEGRNWIAYNTYSYFLDLGDMEFFKEKEETRAFSFDNHSDRDSYSMHLLLQQQLIR